MKKVDEFEEFLSRHFFWTNARLHGETLMRLYPDLHAGYHGDEGLARYRKYQEQLEEIISGVARIYKKYRRLVKAKLNI